jgi:XTP/dITP diphosphohydrolase
MQQLTFATNNQNKVNEIRRVLQDAFNIITLKEAGIHIDIPEPHDTLEANAKEKSTTIYTLTGNDCFSEDTGLFVPAINNEPGVKSARYAGEEGDNEKNIEKLLLRLQNITDKYAYFKTVISLIINGKEHQFVGICEGTIINEKKGCNGFGYDAVFIPNGSNLTFAEMQIDEKSSFSHRKKAMKKMIEFLLPEN